MATLSASLDAVGSVTDSVVETHELCVTDYSARTITELEMAKPTESGPALMLGARGETVPAVVTVTSFGCLSALQIHTSRMIFGPAVRFISME